MSRTVSDNSDEDCRKRCSSRARKRVWYSENGEEELEPENDGHGPPTCSAHCPTTQENITGYLPVTCGNKEGDLDVERLGNGESCIECEGRWFSPPAFEDFGGKASNKKWKASIFYMNKPLHFWFEQGSITTKGFRRRGIEQKKHRKISSSNQDSESSCEVSEAPEEERTKVENGGEVKDSEDETDVDEENEKEDDDPPSTSYSTDNLEASRKHALQTCVKVVMTRLPVMSYEPQTTCDEPSLVVIGSDSPLDGDAESVEEEEEEEWRPRRDAAPSQVSESPPADGDGEDPSGSTPSGEGGGGEVIRVKAEPGDPQSETAASFLELKLEYKTDSENAASVGHRSSLSTPPPPPPPNPFPEETGDWHMTHTGCGPEHDDLQAAPMQTDVKEEDIEATCSPPPTMALVECKYESVGATTDTQDTAPSQEGEEHRRFSQTVKSDMSGPSLGAAALDTMDLDQLKREKAKMQLRVLKLQEEYYTLKIQRLKQ